MTTPQIPQDILDTLATQNVTIHTIEGNIDILNEASVFFNEPYDTHYVVMNGDIVFVGSYEGVSARVYGFFAE